MKTASSNWALQQAKQAVGKAAAAYILPEMVVGLGTGSTAHFFTEALIHRCQEEGLRLKAVIPTSEATKFYALKGGLPVKDIDQFPQIDLTVDGADEVDSQKRIIKGRGGALLREKIVAAHSREMVVIIDETKCVPQLRGPLPVEVVPFGHIATFQTIEKLGYQCQWRLNDKKKLYTTDNQNYLIDISFSSPLAIPEEVEQQLSQIPGVIDTGFFFNLAGRVLIGYLDGKIDVRK